MEFTELLVMIIAVLLVAMLMMACMNGAKKSDAVNHRGTEQTKSKGSGFGVIILAIVVMMACIIGGMSEGLPYKSPAQSAADVVEIIKGGSMERFMDNIRNIGK